MAQCRRKFEGSHFNLCLGSWTKPLHFNMG